MKKGVLPLPLIFTPTQGPVGTSVTLKTDFDLPRLDFVRFNSTLANFTLLNPTTIRAIAPDNFQSGAITIGWYNFILTTTDVFSRTYNPPVVLLENQPLVKAGESIILTGHDFGDINFVRLNNVSLPFVVNDVNQITVEIPNNFPPFTGPFSVITPMYTALSSSITTTNQPQGYGLVPYGSSYGQ